MLSRTCRILKPDGYVIAKKAAKYHRINTIRANLEGADGSTVLREFLSAIEDTSNDCVLVAHKIQFDVNALLNEMAKREVSKQENALRLLTEKMKRCDTHSLRYLETVDVAEYWSTKYGLSLSKMFQLTCPKHENCKALLSRAHDGISNAEMAGAIYFALCDCSAYSHITDRLAKKSRPSCGDLRLVTPQRITGEFSDYNDDDNALAALDLEAAILQTKATAMAAAGGGGAAASLWSMIAQCGHPNDDFNRDDTRDGTADRLAKNICPSCGDSRLVTPQKITGEFSDYDDDDDVLAALDLESAFLNSKAAAKEAAGGEGAAASLPLMAQSGHPNNDFNCDDARDGTADRFAKKICTSCGESRFVTPSRMMREFSDYDGDEDYLTSFSLEATILQSKAVAMAVTGGGLAATVVDDGSKQPSQ